MPESNETKIALLQNNVVRLETDIEELTAIVKDLTKTIETNNALLTRSKGAIWGAVVVLTAAFGGGSKLWNWLSSWAA